MNTTYIVPQNSWEESTANYNAITMTLDVIEKSVDRFIESNLIKDTFTVVFHAGEPMILGTAYYEEVVALIQRGITR